jgi:hypothetical protein
MPAKILQVRWDAADLKILNPLIERAEMPVHRFLFPAFIMVNQCVRSYNFSLVMLILFLPGFYAQMMLPEDA